jgi:hypothetical protein
MTCPSNLHFCKNLDVAIILECPPVAYALDSNIFVDSSVGDPVFVKGFNEENVNNYQATVGELLGEKNETHPPCSGRATFQKNARLLMIAGQILGLSGAGVLNGYGIVGIASARFSHSSAIVTPWADVYNCFKENHKVLELMKKCSSSITVIKPPNLLNIFERTIMKKLQIHFYLKLLRTFMK